MRRYEHSGKVNVLTSCKATKEREKKREAMGVLDCIWYDYKPSRQTFLVDW